MSEELSFQEVEELLENVVNNKKLIEVENKAGSEFVVFSHPSSQDILISRYIRGKALKEATKEGLPSREEINTYIKEKNIIGTSDEERIGILESKIEAQLRLLNLTKIPARRKPIEEVIEKLKKELVGIKNKSEQLYTLTREFRADEEALLFLSWAATFTVTGERRWESFDAFEADTDLILRNSIIENFAVFNRGLSVADIRYIARHVLWRIRYTAALKIGGPLFPHGLHDLTTDQQSLLYWSNFYQSIYEMLPDEQPGDEIIRNDEALDAYMEAYFKRREEERNEGRLKGRNSEKGKLSAGEADEIILTSNNPQYLHMSYSDERIKNKTEAADVEVVSPTSRRAKNRRAARRRV